MPITIRLTKIVRKNCCSKFSRKMKSYTLGGYRKLHPSSSHCMEQKRRDEETVTPSREPLFNVLQITATSRCTVRDHSTFHCPATQYMIIA